MRQAERRGAINKMRIEWSDDSWPTVSNWIRDMVRIEPGVMAKVARAEFGDLGMWIQRGKRNVGVCGCLVGTTALILADERNHFKPVARNGCLVRTTNRGDEYKGYSAYPNTVVAELVNTNTKARKEMELAAERAGCAASDMGNILGQELAVELIKDEIKRQLKFRRNRIEQSKNQDRSVKGRFV